MCACMCAAQLCREDGRGGRAEEEGSFRRVQPSACATLCVACPLRCHAALPSLPQTPTFLSPKPAPLPIMEKREKGMLLLLSQMHQNQRQHPIHPHQEHPDILLRDIKGQAPQLHAWKHRAHHHAPSRSIAPTVCILHVWINAGSLDTHDMHTHVCWMDD